MKINSVDCSESIILICQTNLNKLEILIFDGLKRPNDYCYLLEDDKDSCKIKYYINKENKLVNKVIEFKNSKLDNWKKEVNFNENGQIIFNSRNAPNKNDNNENKICISHISEFVTNNEIILKFGELIKVYLLCNNKRTYNAK